MIADRTALADQITAASRNAVGVLDHLVTDHGQHPGTLVPDRWLRRLVDDSVRRPCEHLTSAPQTVFLLAHQRRVVCARCQQAAAEAMRGTPEDGTCDRCRRRQPDDRLTTAATTAGPVIVPLGLCSNCLPRVHREPAPTSPRPTGRTRR